MLIVTHQGAACDTVTYFGPTTRRNVILVIVELSVYFSLSCFTLLTGRQQGQLACKNLLQLTPKILLEEPDTIWSTAL